MNELGVFFYYYLVDAVNLIENNVLENLNLNLNLKLK